MSEPEYIGSAPDLPVATGERQGADSVQVYEVAPGRDARWAAATYFEWLGGVLGWIVRVETGEDGRVKMILRGLGVDLLELAPRPNGGPDRVVYRIVGGLLARREEGQRFEFRSHPTRRSLVVAMVGFRPSLPAWLYRISHGLVHGLVMYLFGRYLARLPDPDVESE